MSMLTPRKPITLALFEKRIEGDDSLMELARRRFGEARMGTEMQPASLDQLEWLMRWRPSGPAPAIAHLARDVDLAQEESCERIIEFAKRFSKRLYGLVIHDHAALATQTEQYVEAAWEMEKRLSEIPGSPILFVEYAAGLEPSDFTRFCAAIQDLDWVSACIDVGHVGVRQARAAYAQRHPGEDICALKSQPPQLPELMADVEAAVRFGAEAAIDIVGMIGALKKPVHFHLHDAHPLSSISPFGVSDHLSFQAEIPLNFEHNNQRTVAPMFGPEGLAKLVRRAVDAIGPRGLSFTLEIHPTSEKLPLGEASALFRHWADKTNAERMNHWLAVLAQNHSLLRQAIEETAAPGVSEAALEAPVSMALTPAAIAAATERPLEPPLTGGSPVPQQAAGEPAKTKSSDLDRPQPAIDLPRLPRSDTATEAATAQPSSEKSAKPVPPVIRESVTKELAEQSDTAVQPPAKAASRPASREPAPADLAAKTPPPRIFYLGPPAQPTMSVPDVPGEDKEIVGPFPRSKDAGPVLPENSAPADTSSASPPLQPPPATSPPANNESAVQAKELKVPAQPRQPPRRLPKQKKGSSIVTSLAPLPQESDAKSPPAPKSDSHPSTTKSDQP